MLKVGWITFHRWLFENEQSADTLTVDAPSDVVWWHCGADSSVGRDGFRTERGRSWAGAGFFEDRAKAEHVLDDVSSQFPNLPEWGDEFHCLLRPIRFSGVCNRLARADAELATRSG